MVFNYGFEFALGKGGGTAIAARHGLGEAAFVSCPGTSGTCGCVEEKVPGAARRLDEHLVEPKVAEGRGFEMMLP